MKKNKINILDEERKEIYNTSKWRKLRLSYIQEHPLCEICLLKGIIEEAIDVHHIISFMDVSNDKKIDYAFNYNNLQALCKKCHQKIHNERNNI